MMDIEMTEEDDSDDDDEEPLDSISLSNNRIS